MYNIISDKCVGLCLIARKHGYITFPGEMLFQVGTGKRLQTNESITFTAIARVN